jgi:pimeloyl-ACP methyl ester carboxylesterase
MCRRSLPWLLVLALCVALVTPVSTRAEPPPAPVVLIHGHGGSSELTWKTAVAYLEGRGYRRDRSLFLLNLDDRWAMEPMGLLEDAGALVRLIEQILAQTGARQVDLVGHSRGGLVARLAATGDSAALVRRVVTLNTPHQGAMSAGEMTVMLAEAGIPLDRLPAVEIPPDLRANSMALATIFARERRFADRRVPVLTVATTWRPGVPLVLHGHDGAVPVASQLGWPGARTAEFRLGPTGPEITRMLQSELGPGLLVWNSPHLQSHESTAVLRAVADFLLDNRMQPPLRPCEPQCQDWSGLTGHFAERMLTESLAAGELAYTVAANGQRVLDLSRPMTRAEFVYGLTRTRGLPERLRTPSFRDTAGHWALGWVEAAVAAGMLAPGDAFYPDRPITHAEAAALAGTLQGDEPIIGSDLPLPTSEGVLLLLRTRGR